MLTIAEMQAKIIALNKKSLEMRSLCESEGRDPTEAEINEANKDFDEIERLESLIATEQRRLDIEARHAEPEPAQAGQEPVAVADPVEIRADARITPANRGPNDYFESLGDQLQAIQQAGLGRRVDPRLYEVRAATGLSESVGADGGFLLQPSFGAAILEDAFQTGRLAPMCRQQPITGPSNSMKIPAVDETSRATTRHGGTLGYWVAEADEKTASKPKIRQLELNLNKNVVLVYVTDELLQDATALESFVRTSASHEIGFQLDDAVIAGNGAGKPLGILNAGCLVSQTAETGQAAATIVYQNIVKMWSRLFAMSQTSAVWLINQDTFPQLATMSIPVGTGGGPVWIPAGGASEAPYSSLMGRPVMPIEQCKTLGTVGDIILADFSNGYIFSQKGGVQSDMSIHVRFVYDESVFRFIVRVDGQPVRASALTPAQGSNTQSHFIALATRS